MDRDGLTSFVLGVGVGVGLGLIFAPKSGEETRELLKGKADEGKEYLKRRGSELRDSAGEIIERGKEVISRQKDTLAEAVEAGKQAYREAVGQPAGAESQMAR
ncbi:MAG: YtxH domain-containing protein [Acidobacteria bacterium]|nr:MAG: YtxH domain-containing protein [Acidobacteriota bacterium]